MSVKIDFWEIRKGTHENYESICLVKDHTEAVGIMAILIKAFGHDLHCEHIEIVADCSLSVRDY